MHQSRRIDEPIDNYPSYRLYQPLRRSLLRNSLSQSHITIRGELSMSRLNQQDLSTSRISRRMRSLSPQEVENIKTNIFIPVNKRLLPTKNLQLVKNKKYNAIDVQEKVHKPIPAIKFNSLNRFNANKVEQIVYQVQQKPHYIHHTQTNDTYSRQSNSNKMQFNPFKRQQPVKTTNIYTLRNSTEYERGYQRPRDNSQSKRLNGSVRAVSPQMHMSASFGMPTSQTSFAHNVSSIPAPVMINNTSSSTIRANNNNNQYNGNSLQSCNPIRQVPTSDFLPGSRTDNLPASRVDYQPGSRTSFQVQKVSSQVSKVSKGYDFSRLTSSTVNRNGSQDGVSEYSNRKRQEWKYNLYSIFDEPINTRCNKTGCFNNEIIASRPNIYQWQQ